MQKNPTLAVLQPTYISSWGLVMCLGCAAAAPTGAAVTGVVLLLQKDNSTFIEHLKKNF
jgi:hypothetical protein